MEECAQMQDTIGQENLFYRRISKSWGKLNRKLLEGGKYRLDATTWTVLLARELMNMETGHWIVRNKGEHRTSRGPSVENREQVV